MALISIVPVAPLRATSSHQSEMVSQLLFGESCTMLESNGDFVKVKCQYDDYEGWCQKAQLADDGENENQADPLAVTEREVNIKINQTNSIIPFGSMIKKSPDNSYTIGGYKIDAVAMSLTNSVSSSEISNPTELLLKYAHLYLGTSYLWGGKSVWGVDCSGFVQQVFKAIGKKLPRDAYQQAEVGDSVGFIQEANAGDLAFFDNEEGKITHVGILLNDHSIIHSSGYVHIDSIDHAGIIHHVTGKRTHRLRLIRRIL